MMEGGNKKNKGLRVGRGLVSYPALVGPGMPGLAEGETALKTGAGWRRGP